METIEEIINTFLNGNVVIGIAMLAVALLIIVITIAAVFVSIVLAIRYVKYNRWMNSSNLTGTEAARKILDANGLQNVRVKTTGSLMFGNSYSHYFKTVRLRRLTFRKTSLTSLAMGSQKAALAVLDKEGDKDMKLRIKLVPFITFGPLAFIPLVAIGILIDLFLFNTHGVSFFVILAIAFIFYLISIIMSVKTLKTEKKAQNLAYKLLRENGMATEEELDMMKELFKIYNIQYINDIILSSLELLWRILQLVARVSASSKKSSSRTR